MVLTITHDSTSPSPLRILWKDTARQELLSSGPQLLEFLAPLTLGFLKKIYFHWSLVGAESELCHTGVTLSFLSDFIPLLALMLILLIFNCFIGVDCLLQILLHAIFNCCLHNSDCSVAFCIFLFQFYILLVYYYYMYYYFTMTTTLLLEEQRTDL